MQGSGVKQRTLFHDDTAAGPAGSGRAVFPAPEFREKTTLQTDFFHPWADKIHGDDFSPRGIL
jgi:hypothetical protein